jgi:hypothetical protein
MDQQRLMEEKRDELQARLLKQLKPQQLAMDQVLMLLALQSRNMFRLLLLFLYQIQHRAHRQHLSHAQQDIILMLVHAQYAL